MLSEHGMSKIECRKRTKKEKRYVLNFRTRGFVVAELAASMDLSQLLWSELEPPGPLVFVRPG